MRLARSVAALALTASACGGCLPAFEPGSLPPTLTVVDVDGGSVAMQNGIPVPSFDRQARPRIDLDGGWLVEAMALDADLSLTDRSQSLSSIEAEGGGREAVDYDDAAWKSAEVPGSLNPPPAGEETGGWYRRTFRLPASWRGSTVILSFASANYLADIWVNGSWVGYHEGGYTPFALDVSSFVVPARRNVLAVRVDNPAWGTRTDIVPWGLGDWWNYGGLTGPVWLEARPPVHLVRADVVPHLDAAEVSTVIHQATAVVGEPNGVLPDELVVRAEILPAEVTGANLTDADPRRLVPADAAPLATTEAAVAPPEPGGSAVIDLRFDFANADLWSPASPALYVLRVALEPRRPSRIRGPGLRSDVLDELWTSFGLRDVAVEPVGGRLLLNGEPTMLRGVGLHDEELEFAADASLAGGTPSPSAAGLTAALGRARDIGADLLRAGHTPADPALLMLADRLGFAVWEEIPLYHFTPLTFETAMGRGIPQQMLREMALRDMNRPSVLFHGLANESTGEEERVAALAELHEVDRAIDGTRLTGQAAYGWAPSDATHAPLDVAGFTFYHGVFYGEELARGTREALRVAHATQPEKPIVVLEFGRWADSPADEAIQRRVFDETYAELARRRGDRPGGYVAVATWWSLDDFATSVRDIGVERFGLFRPDGTLRSAGEAALTAFEPPATTAGAGATQAVAGESDLEPAPTVIGPAPDDWRLALYLAYALGFSVLLIGAATLALVRRGGRAIGRRVRA